MLKAGIALLIIAILSGAVCLDAEESTNFTELGRIVFILSIIGMIVCIILHIIKTRQ